MRQVVAHARGHRHEARRFASLTWAARARTVKACDACSPACSLRPLLPAAASARTSAASVTVEGPAALAESGLRARRARARRAPPRHHGALREHATARARSTTCAPARRSSRSPTARPPARRSSPPTPRSSRPGRLVLYGDDVLVGPAADPAGVAEGRTAGHRRRAAPGRDRRARRARRLRRRRHRPRRARAVGRSPRSCAASSPCPSASAGTTTARPTRPRSCAARRPASSRRSGATPSSTGPCCGGCRAGKGGARGLRILVAGNCLGRARRHRGARASRARLRHAEGRRRAARAAEAADLGRRSSRRSSASRRARRRPTTPPRRRCSCSRTACPTSRAG